MMENRSFDHYLGWLPGADGRQAGLDVHRQARRQARDPPARRLLPVLRLPRPRPLVGRRPHRARRRPDGWIPAAPPATCSRSGTTASTTSRSRPYNAKAFTAFDRFFCSLLARRTRTASTCTPAQSYGMMDNSLPFCPDGELGFPDTTIFASLTDKRDLEPVLLHRHPGLGAVGGARARCARARSRSSTSGGAPARSRRSRSSIPRFSGEDQGTSGDEHPLADVRIGQAFMADVVHAVMESPQWKRTALFCIYDEWGGFFDHVVPPRVPDLRSSTNLEDDFGQMGFRIPAVLVSPYARRGLRRPLDLRLRVDPEDDPLPLRAAAADSPRSIREQHRGSVRLRVAAALRAGRAADARERDREPPCPGTSADRQRRHRASTTAACSGRRCCATDDRRRARAAQPVRHGFTSGYLDRLGFSTRPATAATMFRHPSKLGFSP